MTVIASPNHPARLLRVLASSLAAFGLLAAAALAVLYIIDSERAPAAPPAPSVDANVDLPPGMVLIRRVEDEDAWLEELGFRPLVAESVPDGVDPAPLYFVQQPDAAGRRAGHVRYADAGGGLLVVLVQHLATIEEAGAMQATEAESGRAYVQWVACGEIAVQAQLFFSAEGGLPATETSRIAETFVGGIQRQCA